MIQALLAGGGLHLLSWGARRSGAPPFSPIASAIKEPAQ
jgi:hypothetical protein